MNGFGGVEGEVKLYSYPSGFHGLSGLCFPRKNMLGLGMEQSNGSVKVRGGSLEGKICVIHWKWGHTESSDSSSFVFYYRAGDKIWVLDLVELR